MSEVDPETVRRVARLARLELSDDEVERLAGEMGEVLSRFAELEAAEDAAPGDGGEDAGRGEKDGAPASEEATDGEDPDGHPTLRDDRPDADPMTHGPDAMAPEWEDGFFLVPRLEAPGEGDDPG